MIKHKKWLGLCTLAGATLCIGVLTHHEVPEPELPISDTAQQAEFEDQVAEFLDNNPQPDSSDLDYTVKGKNAYWQELAHWWEKIPWDAVAGQWGRVNYGDSVTFNPPNDDGVVTAGHGGAGNCGGVSIGGMDTIFSVPDTRTNIVNEAPEQFAQFT